VPVISPFVGYSGMSQDMLKKCSNDTPTKLDIFHESLNPLLDVITKEINKCGKNSVALTKEWIDDSQ
jgi:hypothetical protein